MKSEHLSLIPTNYKDKGDPRALMYNFPSLPKVKFAKLMNQFWYYKALESVETAANKLGYLLVPSVCMTWRRKGDYAADRKVVVNARSFFMMKMSELTRFEREKLEHYVRTEVLGEDDVRCMKSS